MISSINSLHSHIQPKLSQCHIETPWTDTRSSIAERVASMHSSIKAAAELYPQPTENTAIRLTLTSAYLNCNSDSDTRADIEEAIIIMRSSRMLIYSGNCPTNTHVRMQRQTNHTEITYSPRPNTQLRSPLRLQLTQDDRAPDPRLITALYDFIVLTVSAGTEDEHEIETPHATAVARIQKSPYWKGNHTSRTNLLGQFKYHPLYSSRVQRSDGNIVCNKEDHISNLFRHQPAVRPLFDDALNCDKVIWRKLTWTQMPEYFIIAFNSLRQEGVQKQTPQDESDSAV